MPYLCNIKPSGAHPLLDLENSGGIPAVMKAVEPLLDGNAMTCTGKTVKENLKDVPLVENDVLFSLEHPKRPEAALEEPHTGVEPLCVPCHEC